MTTEAEKVLKRFNIAVKRKTNWDELYEDGQTYTSPNREIFNGEDVPGQEKSGRGIVFDSTGQDSLQKFASNIQSSLTPPFRQWLQLEPGPALEGDPEAAKGLREITDLMFGFLQSSNFDTQIAESYLDLGLGTGALLVFKGTSAEPFHFVNVPLAQLYLEEGPKGRVETAFRKSKIALRNIEQTWPDAELSRSLKEKLAEKPEQEISVIEATFPDKGQVLNRESQEMEEGDIFRYMVIVKNSKEIIVNRTQRFSPWVIFRWSTIPGEIYGRGPVLFALPDIKTLNKTKELLLKAASISIFGMYTVEDDGMTNIENIKLGAGAIIPVSSNGGSRPATLAPLAPPGDPNLAQLIISDLKASINNMMFADPLGPVDLPVKTATEISMRQQELARRIGSAFGKLQFELITPLVNRLLDILDELGLIDLGAFRVDGNNIAIKHVSPLAQAQEEEEIVNTMRLAEIIAGLYGPEVLMGLIPPDKLTPKLAAKLNVDSEVLSTKEEVEALKQGLAQAAQQGPPV